MVMRVQVVDGEYRVVVPPEAVEAREGAAVQVVPLAEPEKSRYVGVEEGMKAYFRPSPCIEMPIVSWRSERSAA